MRGIERNTERNFCPGRKEEVVTQVALHGHLPKVVISISCQVRRRVVCKGCKKIFAPSFFERRLMKLIYEH